MTVLLFLEERFMAKNKKEVRTFKQYRDEWMGAGNSDNINYCMPVNVGIITQTPSSLDRQRLDAAVEKIMNRLGRWFGRFSGKNKTPSHNQLVVMFMEKDDLAKNIALYLQERYDAKPVYADKEDIKEYCWVTIAVWDGITTTGTPVYQTVREILSTADTPSENYKLRFPENRPIFQIVLPDSQNSLPEVNYKVHEIYPHMLETINDGEPWFSRRRFKDEGALKKRRDPKHRNFKRNAKKIKEFNRKISSFSHHVDRQKKNIFDLLPWHHQDKKLLPRCAEVSNLRQIYYDIISMKAQTAQKLQNRVIMLLALVALCCFSVYSDLIEIYWLLVAYLVFIAVAYLFYWIFVKGINAHNKYLEFRALAEGMRVQCYWYAAGINESVGSSYTVKFQKDMFWAIQAFNAWYVQDYLIKENGDGTASLEAAPMKGHIPNNDYIKTEWLGTLLKKGDDNKYYINLPKDCPPNMPEQLRFFTRRIYEFSEKNARSR